MSDDFIKVKPKFWWFEFDLNALWRKLRRAEKNNPVVIVAERFLQLFVSHGVAVPQIPQYIPQITLDKLTTPETLLAALDSDVLDQSARLFKVRRQWLDGVDDQIYDSWFCYKAPARLFENLVSLKIEIGSFPVRVLYSGQKLDGTDDREQSLALLLVEKIGDLGDEEICRYTIFGDTWDWGQPICRIQLKAMARLVDKTFENPVPLYRVKPDVLEKIREGKCVPRQYLIGSPLTEPSLEDYALDVHESAQSKEAEEIPHVLEYIKHHDLESVAKRALKGKL